MQRSKLLLAACLLGLAPLAPAPARAQTLAEVGGVSLTLGDVIAANPAARHDQKLREQVLVELINRQAVLNEAARLGVAKSAAFEHAVKTDRENLLIRSVAEKFNKAHPISQAELEAAYKKAFDKPFPEEYRLRMILVDSFATAKEAMSQLKSGKSFSMLAAATSKDAATAPLGGETGWQVATSLAAPVLKAVKAAKLGEVVGPISVPHGFVVVQLLGERPTPKPTLDQVKTRLEAGLRQQAWVKHVVALRTAQGAHLIVALPSQ